MTLSKTLSFYVGETGSIRGRMQVGARPIPGKTLHKLKSFFRANTKCIEFSAVLNQVDHQKTSFQVALEKCLGEYTILARTIGAFD